MIRVNRIWMGLAAFLMLVAAQAHAQSFSLNNPAFSVSPVAGSSFSTTPTTCSITGTIAAVNASVTLNCPGMASAVVTVTGTYNGTLRFRGSVDGTMNAPGGRLVFKSGVGSLGTNTISSDGTVAVANEYRVVGGGTTLVIDAPSWTSGSAAISVMASMDATISFVNGPTHSSDEEAVRAGRGFIMSTGAVSVPAGSYLNIAFNNPAGSGKNVFLTFRSFGTTSTTALSYVNRRNPGAISGGTTGNIANRDPASSTASVASFTYQASTTALSAGTTGTADNIYPSVPNPQTIFQMIPPGYSVGYAIGGAGGGLAATANVSANFAEFEESIN